MNSTAFIEPSEFLQNSTTITTESWFIPFDILMIICTILVIILSTFFLYIIVFDKTCHTVSMMLTANSCLSTLVFGCSMLSLCIFTLQNDVKQIEYQDSLSVFRGYIGYVSCALVNFSFLLQSIYRYIIVIYPHRLFYQVARYQVIRICSSWLTAFIYPIAVIFTGGILYNADNQICQIPLRLSFSTIYFINCIYVIPNLILIFVYFKLVRYVKGMSKRVTPANTLFRAQKELKMVQRTVILGTILVTLGFPYTLFILISLFTDPPKYHFRIAYIFVDVSLVCVVIALYQFTDPLKTSIMKRINGRINMVIPTVT